MTADSRFQVAARHFYASVFLPDLRAALNEIAKKCIATPVQAQRAKSHLVWLHQGHRKLLDCEASRVEFDRHVVARLHAEFARIDAKITNSQRCEADSPPKRAAQPLLAGH